MSSLLDRKLFRRFVYIPIVALIQLSVVVVSPIIFVLTLIADLVTRQPRIRYTRLALLVVAASAIELLGLIAALVAWIVTGFGFLGSQQWRWHLHRPLMGWYATTLLELLARILGTTVTWRSTHVDPSVVVVARHTSFFDALIPGALLSKHNSLLAHHVLTDGLRYSPCLDVVGHRFPIRFIKRVPGASSVELQPIQALGGHVGARSAAVIFPEGTFRNPQRFERVVGRLSERQPELAQRAAQLRHVLPPRPNGTYALLQGASDADVMVCVNTGLEAFGSLKAITSQPWSDVPIVIDTWRIPRAEVPMDSLEDFGTWLLGVYEDIDAWVDEVRSNPARAAKQPERGTSV